MTEKPSVAGLIAAHLNAPYGAIVSADDVVHALKTGRIAAPSPRGEAVLATMFVEVEPMLIARAASEVGEGLAQAHRLYLSAVASGSPRCVEWEHLVREVV